MGLPLKIVRVYHPDGMFFVAKSMDRRFDIALVNPKDAYAESFNCDINAIMTSRKARTTLILKGKKSQIHLLTVID
jgi:hypothetical protein